MLEARATTGEGGRGCLWRVTVTVKNCRMRTVTCDLIKATTTTTAAAAEQRGIPGFRLDSRLCSFFFFFFFFFFLWMSDKKGGCWLTPMRLSHKAGVWGRAAASAAGAPQAA